MIVVNYNGRDFLERLLPSLWETDYPQFSVTVVDNASTDGSVEWLRGAQPRARVIARSHNDGFSVAANEGLRDLAADAAVLLNPDLVVPRTWLRELVDAAWSHPAIAVAGAIPVTPSELTAAYEPPPQLPSVVPVSKVAGAAMLVKRDALRHVGLLDEWYFLYWEDTEYCWRTILRGRQVVYAPNAWVVHDRGGIVRRSTDQDRIRLEKAKGELYTLAKIDGPEAARARRRWFRLRALIRPRKNLVLRQASAWLTAHESDVREARRRDVGEPDPALLERLERMKRADRRIDRAFRRHRRGRSL